MEIVAVSHIQVVVRLEKEEKRRKVVAAVREKEEAKEVEEEVRLDWVVKEEAKGWALVVAVVVLPFH
jgi:hypothetical protein